MHNFDHECACHPSVDTKIEFLDKAGVLYLCELIKTGAQKMINVSISKSEAKLMEEIENQIGNCFVDVQLSGNKLIFIFGDGTKKELVVSGISGGGSNIEDADLATNADIAEIFNISSSSGNSGN